MPKKESATKKLPAKKEKKWEYDKKLIIQRVKEFTEWMIKNKTQKRFFSLEEREQKLLETSYIVVLQMCPEVTWEDYLNRLRMIDTCNTKTKSVVKNVPLKLLNV